MSKRRKKQKKIPAALIALVAGGLLLIVAALFFSMQNKDGNGTPVLTVDQQKIDYGDVKFNTEETFAIKVTNNGDGILRFKEKPYIQVMEGC
jgi:hypothetical protein